jgi:Ala-tRNA(Pro) deacylase
MRVIEFLDRSGVKYELREHLPVFSAQGLAAAEHEHGKYVAKPVIVKADSRYIMCVLPAPQKVDLGKLKAQLAAESVELADEDEIGKLFPDCELGAEPPFGHLYDLPTVMDKSLEQDDHILFQGGTHGKAIHIAMADYRKLASPKVLEFSF